MQTMIPSASLVHSLLYVELDAENSVQVFIEFDVEAESYCEQEILIWDECNNVERPGNRAKASSSVDWSRCKDQRTFQIHSNQHKLERSKSSGFHRAGRSLRCKHPFSEMKAFHRSQLLMIYRVTEHSTSVVG